MLWTECMWLRVGSSWRAAVNTVVKIQDIKPTKCTKLFLRCVYYSVTLNVTTCFGPKGTVSRESNQSKAAQNQISHFYTQLT